MKRTIGKVIIMIMALAMVASFAACGGGDTDNELSKEPEQEQNAFQTVIDTYKLNMSSTEEQPMSEARATKEQLKALKSDYFKGIMMFEGTEFEGLTYADIKEQLGVDASYYYFEDALVEKQCFVWQAEGDDNSKLLISFTNGKLYGLGAANLG